MKGKLLEKASGFRNRPMKSPSPDYYCSNKNTNTNSPFKEVTKYLYNKSKASTHRENIDPTQNSPSINKKSSCCLPNQNIHQLQSEIVILSVKIHKLYDFIQTNISSNNCPKTSEEELDHIQQLLENHFKSIKEKSNNSSKLYETFGAQNLTVNHLQVNLNKQLSKQINQLKEQNKLLSKQLEEFEKISHRQKSRLTQLPIIRKSVQYGLSISPHKQTPHISESLVINKGPIRHSLTSKQPLEYRDKSLGQKSNASSLMYYRQKIKYLQSELENKNTRIQVVEGQKEMEMHRLQQKLEIANYLLENEMENYNKIIEKLKRKLNKYQKQATNLNSHQGDNYRCRQKREDSPIREVVDFQKMLDSPKQPQFKRSTKNNIQDYQVRECLSEQQDPNITANVHQITENIRNYYENILEENQQQYRKKLQMICGQVRLLKEQIKIAEQQQEKQHHEACPKCHRLQYQIQSLKIEAEQQKNEKTMLIIKNDVFEREKEKFRKVIEKYVSENRDIEAKEEIERYKNKLLYKLSKYWNINISQVLSPSSSFSNFSLENRLE